MQRFLFKIVVFGLLIGLVGCGKRLPEEGTVNVNGMDVYYKTVGQGRPLVVLHGGPGLDHGYFLPYFEELAKEYRLIFYDQRGTGNTGGAVTASTMRVDHFISDLEGLRKAFGLSRMNLLGHDWGGLLAMLYASRFPENMNTLILVSPQQTDPTIQRVTDVYLSRKQNPEDKEDENRIRLEAANVKSSEELTDDQIAGYKKELYRISLRPYFYDRELAKRTPFDMAIASALERDRVEAFLRPQLKNYDIEKSLPKITCPTLVVHGYDDPAPYQPSEHIHHQLAKSEWVLLEDCGHFPFIESSEKFFQACSSFLKKH